jgi:hypothetical protein
LQSNFLARRLKYRQQLSEGFPQGREAPAEGRTIGFHSISPLRKSRLVALISDKYDDDSARPEILCRIAHIHSDCSISDCKDVDARLVSELSNSDQLSLSI